jgi:hypothetical protein
MLDEHQLPEVRDAAEKHGTIANVLTVLHSFSIVQLAAVVVVLLVTGSCVWWFANRHIDERLQAKDNQIESARLEERQKWSATVDENRGLKEKTNQQEREVKELRGKNEELKRQVDGENDELAKLKQKAEFKNARTGIAGTSVDHGVPPDALIQFDATSLPQFVALRARAEEADNRTGQTALQKCDLGRLFAGRRMRWTGFVHDVRRQGGNEIELLLNVTSDRSSAKVSCFFEFVDHYEELAALTKGQNATVTGIIGSDGNLCRCSLFSLGRPTAFANR